MLKYRDDPPPIPSKHHFLLECYSCHRKHRMKLQPCPDCSGRSGQWTPQPVSEKVYESCHADYACDGCVAYRDHLR